jgi:hypothetical protein
MKVGRMGIGWVALWYLGVGWIVLMLKRRDLPRDIDA